MVVVRRVWPLVFLLAACGEDGPTFLGEVGAPVSAIVDSNLFFVPTTIEGQAGPHLAVDTGAPFVVVAPDRAPASSNAGLNEATSFEMLGLEFSSFEYLVENLLSVENENFVAGGVVGCTAFCTFDVSFDYRAQTLTLDGASPPADAIEALMIPVSFEGGGVARDDATGQRFSFPRSRVIVDAQVEGRSLRMLLDSGASSAVIRASLADELLSDGRQQLEAPALGMFGMDTAALFRVKTFVVGGETIEEVIVAKSPAFESLLDGIEKEIDSTIDGVIGGTVLREFYVTMAYEREILFLDRYASRDHIRDEGLRIGVRVTKVSGDFVEVGEVSAGTDAEAQGVQIRDRITAVDGVLIRGQSDVRVAEMLSGTKNQTRNVTFGCEGCPGYNGVRAILVDDDVLSLSGD